MQPQRSAQYKKLIIDLDKTVNRCIRVSRACSGIPSPTGAHFYASVLFTSLCTRAVTLAMMIPHSPWAKQKMVHWDYSSAAGVVRSILEVRIAFFYLCAEQVSADEWECRWNVFNLHDCTSRLHLFENIPNSEDQLAGFQVQREELVTRLAGNSFFLALPDGQRKKILNGQSAYLSSLEQIAERAGVAVDSFRLLYKLFSSQVHGFPLSYYRMSEMNRGRGVHSESEESYTAVCIAFAVELLVAATDEMKSLFPSAKNV